jgi:hypothetical protein
LSYSPARRNPEKYRDILGRRSSDKNRKPAPVVKLTTSDRDSSDSETENGNKSTEKVEEFLPIDRNQEKELDRLKALKSELAVKAKESLEKKIISEIASTSSNSTAVSGRQQRNLSPPQPERAREMEIIAQTVAISSREKKDREEKKIVIKPFKINDTSPLKTMPSSESAKPEVASRPVATRKSRSRSKSSHGYVIVHFSNPNWELISRF